MMMQMMIRARLSAVALALAALAAPAAAQTCREMSHEDRPYSVCTVAPGGDLRLWLSGPDTLPVGTFERLRKLVTEAGGTLIFAMNAGMYHADRRPVGLYIEDGTEYARLVTRAGPGNFGLLPNGLLCISPGGVRVIETLAYAAAPPDCTHASQSGPMLVIDGALHPGFLVDATSRNIRNGVGVGPDGTAYFAVSDRPVTFHEFARLFRDGLGVVDALYLDGSVSRLYAPELGRSDFGTPMGPIVGLVLPDG